MDTAAEIGRNSVSTRFSLSMDMSRLTRDGTAEPVSQDQTLRHVRGQGNIHFPCSADHEQDWQPYPVNPYSALCDDHTYVQGVCAIALACTVYTSPLNGFEIEPKVGIAESRLLYLPPRSSVVGHVTIKSGNNSAGIQMLILKIIVTWSCSRVVFTTSFPRAELFLMTDDMKSP